MSPENCPGIFVIFEVFFVPLNNFLDFSGIVFALKINWKKIKPYPNGSSPKARPVFTRPDLGPFAKPIWA
jgi:hypothetical protein